MRIRKKLKYEEKAYCDELYDKYRKLMFKRARFYDSSGSLEEDIVQESVIKLCHYVDRLKTMEEGARVVYIIYTVWTTAITINKKLAKDRELLYDYFRERSDPGYGSAEDEFLRQASKDELDRVFAALPERDSVLLTGRYVVGLSDEEIAEMLECKPSSVRMFMTRARNRARAKFEEEGIKYERV